MIPRLVAVAAGIWLMFAPAVFGYGDPAAANDRILGPIGASFAFVAIWEATRPLRWATLPVGLWLIVAPFALGYSEPASVVSSLAAGIAMAGSSLFGGDITQQFGGGWSALVSAQRADRDSP